MFSLLWLSFFFFFGYKKYYQYVIEISCIYVGGKKCMPVFFFFYHQGQFQLVGVFVNVIV